MVVTKLIVDKKFLIADAIWRMARKRDNENFTRNFNPGCNYITVHQSPSRAVIRTMLRVPYNSENAVRPYNSENPLNVVSILKV
jgi:hypothetical protein